MESIVRPTQRLMIVEDDPVTALALQEFLAGEGYDIAGPCTTGREAVALARKVKPTLVLMDIVLPGAMDGIAASKIIQDELDIPTIFISENSADHIIKRETALEPLAYIPKPFTKEQLCITVELALHRKRIADRRKENEKKEEQLRLQQALMELELEKRKAQIGKINQKLKQYLKKEIQARREKAERERRWQHLVEAMNEGFVIANENTITTYVNKRLCEMTGYTEAELVGKPCRDFIAEPSRDALERYHETRRKGVRSKYEAVWIAKDGTRLSVLHSVVPLFDEKQNYQGIYMVITDISDFKKTQKALEKREAQLHEANLALKTMLKRRTEEAAEDKKRMIHNLRVMVFPLLDKLRNTHRPGSQRVLADHLEKTLTDLLSPFARTLSSALYNLSPTEIRIANLIRQGYPSKEIAQILGLSTRTVEVHRTHIRKKLKLTGKKINLRSYLSTLQP